MIDDDVLREIRAVREAFAAAHHGDVHAMGAALRRRAAEDGRPTVRLPPRPINLAVMRSVARRADHPHVQGT